MANLTSIETTVAKALRLSSAAAGNQNIIDEIDRNVEAAKAELIRMGTDETTVSSEGALVSEAIVTYCLMNMGDEAKYEMYFSAWQYQADNLRKAYPAHEE